MAIYCTVLGCPGELSLLMFSGEQTIKRQCSRYAGETSFIQLGFIIRAVIYILCQILHAFTECISIQNSTSNVIIRS